MPTTATLAELLRRFRDRVAFSSRAYAGALAKKYNAESEYIRCTLVKNVDADEQASWTLKFSYRPGDDEKYLASLRVPDELRSIRNNGFSPYLVDVDRKTFVYKTFEDGWHGTANNELAYSRVDRLFGFELALPVAKVRGPEGPGILLPWIRSTEGMSPSGHRYPGLQPQMAAIDDYVMGQGGGGPLNTLTDQRHGKRGNLVIIDNEHCLVLPGDRIQSDFVASHLNAPLDEKLLADLQARVHPEELRAVLASCRIEPAQAAAAVDRLEEVLAFGRITCAAHGGPIVPTSVF